LEDSKGITSKEDLIEIELKLEGKWPVQKISDSISLLGYPKVEFLEQGLEFGAIMPQDDFEAANKQIKELLRSGSEEFNLNLKIYSKQGDLLTIKTSVHKLTENTCKFTLRLERSEKVSDSLIAYKMASLIARFYIFEYHIQSRKLFIDWTISDVNSDNLNLKLQELPNWLDLIAQKDRNKLASAIEQSVQAQCDIANLELEMYSPLGYTMQATFSAKLFKDANGVPEKLIGVLSDISKHKMEMRREEKNSKMLHTLVDIIRQKELRRDEMLKYAMEKAIDLTDSKIGYIYLFDEKTNKFTLINWSKEVMAQCKVTEPQTQYELEKTGIWGEVVRQRQPIILNDFTKPNKFIKGTPQGHVPLQRWCAIPVIYEEKIVATLGVANSDNDYMQEDVEILTQLMDGVWDYIVDQSLFEEVKTKEQTLDSYVNLAPMIILGLDKDGIVININKPGAEILGGEQKDIIGKNWFENFLPDSLAVKMRSVFGEYAAGKELENDTFTHEVITIKKQTKIILWKNLLLKDHDGNFQMVLSAGQDITLRENLMTQLKSNQGKFEQYIKGAPLGIFVVNKLGQIKEVNESGCQFLGYSKEDLLKKSISDIVDDKERARTVEAFQKFISEGNIKGEYYFKKADGNIAVGALNATKIDEDSYLGFIQDITDQVKVNDKLIKQNQELSQMNNLMIERELKMRELKAEIAALKAGKVV
jgi:PAS domain S-box-containing protein